MAEKEEVNRVICDSVNPRLYRGSAELTRSIPFTIAHPVASTAIPVVAQSVVRPDTRPVVAGMTARTVGRIGWRGPGYNLAVAGVAVPAAQSRPMITRIVAASMHISRSRQPSVGCMANIALLGGYEVTRRGTGCGGAIVAAAATADHIRMINPDHRRPRGVAMAILANVRGVYMAAVLSLRSGAVVTPHTVGGVIRVIEIGRHPCSG